MRAARSAACGCGHIDDAQEEIAVPRDCRRRLIEGLRAQPQPIRGVHDVRVAGSALAVFTVAVRRHRNIERPGPEVGDAAQPVEGLGSPFSSSPLAGHIPPLT